MSEVRLVTFYDPDDVEHNVPAHQIIEIRRVNDGTAWVVTAFGTMLEIHSTPSTDDLDDAFQDVIDQLTGRA